MSPAIYRLILQRGANLLFATIRGSKLTSGPVEAAPWSTSAIISESSGSVLALELRDEAIEFGRLVQAFEMWIDLEEGPAGKTSLYGTLQPCHRSFLVSQRAVDAGDFVVQVVRVAERMRSIQGFAHALQGKLVLISPGV